MPKQADATASRSSISIDTELDSIHELELLLVNFVC